MALAEKSYQREKRQGGGGQLPALPEKVLTVSQHGNTRGVSLGAYIPKEWAFVRVTGVRHKDGSISLHLERVS